MMMMMMVRLLLFSTVLLLLVVTHAADQYHHNDEEEEEDDDVLDSFIPRYVSPELIMELSDYHGMDELHRVLRDSFRRSERNVVEENVFYRITKEDEVQGKGKLTTTEHKLLLDLEQAEYLSSLVFQNKAKARFFGEIVAPIYAKVLENRPFPTNDIGFYTFTQEDIEHGISDVYNKAWHVTDFDELLEHDTGEPLPLINDAIYNAQYNIEQEYKENNSIVVVDDLLTPQALQRIRQLLLESTVWYETKSPVDTGRYTGAYLNDGLHDRILLQLAFELRSVLPNIIQGPLAYLWAYKYESRNEGIKTHTDFASVNVNLWITPNDANLDPTTGGLVVFTTKPPDGVDFDTNSPLTDSSAFDAFLQATHHKNVTVPYRQNRAIIFDSALFHHTDNFKFKEGYKNRRINLTILYGNKPDYDEEYHEKGEL
jgi:hypothetical protein